MRVNLVLLLVIVAIFGGSSILGQSPNASISGVVLDPDKKSIAEAEILVVNDYTRVQYEAKTNAEGFFAVSNLPPGQYRIQVSKVGFKAIIKPDIILNVQDALAINFTLPIGASSVVVTVEGGAPLINTQSGAVGTVIDRNFVESLPLNGRSFNTLLQLTPGVVIVPSGNGGALGQFSIGGQRTNGNSFLVDGASANFGTAPYLALGQSGLGGQQAFNALGGTSSLVSVDALQEFRIETSSFDAEFGRSPGGQVLLTTRSGTNQFHGGIFDYFRNDALDANDWFANSLAGSPHAAERHNDFGGFLGGRLRKDKSFFFFSYEGARLRLPASTVISVPSAAARSSASPQVGPYLDAYPAPNGPTSADGTTAQFTGVYSNQATLNATSLRIDNQIGNKASLFARYNYAPSRTVSRTGSLSSSETQPSNVQTGTVGVNLLTGGLSQSIRGNYSTQGAFNLFALDSFGGAKPPTTNALFSNLPVDATNIFFTISGMPTLFDGANTRNRTKQFNVMDGAATIRGAHAVKFGIDYRLLDLDAKLNRYQLNYQPGTVAQLLASGETGTLVVFAFNEGQVRSQSLALYGQDSWRLTARLTLSYGVRWEFAPAPAALNGTSLAAWTNTNSPSEIVAAPQGAALWKTSYGNFAPRLGLAYQPTQRGDLVLRAGWGIFYDVGAGAASNLVRSWPNSQSMSSQNVPLPIADVAPYVPPIGNFSPPYRGTLSGLSPDLKLPMSYQWNLAVEKSFVGKQVITATYSGQAGENLLRLEALAQPNANFAPGSVFQLTNNSANSNYQAMQVQYRKPLSDHVQALLNYTWSHSIDNSSADQVVFFSNSAVALSEQGDRGNSDFDVRHSFSGAFTYEIPAAQKVGALKYLTQDWSVEGVVVARTDFPLNASVLAASPVGFNVFLRPNLVPGQNFWSVNATAPGGKMLNPNAFSIPSPLMQGNEGRNDIPGFGLTEVDLSLARRFHMREPLTVEFRTDAFNLLNHPNFTNPLGYFVPGTVNPTLLRSSEMLSQGLGGLNPLFQIGGPRSLQLSLRLSF